ncbi:MAG: glycoside hydrolase [Actinomycetota bacterium]|nr:glycoside hydrolase [Actinomycetota bacterium]
MKTRAFALLVGAAVLTALIAVPIAPAGASGGDTLVSVGSPASPFAQNKQNEPAVAIDANHPNVVAAGANDEIDFEACNAGLDTTCPFTSGVGTSGVYFSLNSGATWVQPTYTGYSARNCLGAPGGDDTSAPCVPENEGPLGTLPWYYENGLVSDGDPALAFGPAPGPDGFDWANGSRLYYANLTHGFPGNSGLKGYEGLAVSRTDDVAAAARGDKDAWMSPVIASKQASATFSDKEQIWADNAESSPFFGNTYICFARFQGGGAAPMTVLTSRDGGDTWASKQVSPAHNVSPKKWGQSGCTVRTDSSGTVYVFYDQFQNPSVFPNPVGTHFVVRSFDGGFSWTRPVAIGSAHDPCSLLQFDATSYRCVMDGIGGARDDLAGSPNVSIANGAPTGEDATDELVLAYVDAATVNHEHVMVKTSWDGVHWGDPVQVEGNGDRGYYTAPALSPDGTDLYLVYNAFTTPLRNDTTSPRGLVGVVMHAEVAGDGSLSYWTEIHRGAVGDPRASSQNNIAIEFLGDYVYAAATNDYGVAVWNDVRNAADCPAVDTWRAALQVDPSTYPAGRPAIEQDCPAHFGNTDIYGGSYPDTT